MPTPPEQISKDPTMHMQKDELAHWPIKVEKRKLSKLGKENCTDASCSKCEAGLCFAEKCNCLRQFHDNELFLSEKVRTYKKSHQKWPAL